MTPDPVTFAADRAATRPAFLAFALAEYTAAEGLDPAVLADRLGCTSEVLAHVGLCRTPPADPDGFRKGIARICDRFGVNPEPLGAAVQLGHTMAAVRAQPTDPAETGHLLAARDRPPQ